ncbi:hypothetical protein [Glaciihabitans sp. dw_435]|uniref:hypothetical protein n=1 Tax=Glaciihabitans sp. dw_435 TaxID=2720081 RepID=UPI001BD374DD|nr:hypothetical protein [Glaciihabitans sp. dw_435]
MANGERGIEALKPNYTPGRGDGARTPRAIRQSATDRAPRKSSPKPPRGPKPAKPTRAERAGRRTILVGVFALALALGAVVLVSVGINLAYADEFAQSSRLAVFAIVVSIAGFLVGGVAVITGRGRSWGAVAMGVSLLANPVVLTQLIGWLSHVIPT